jgi:hypothetical protein
MEPAELEDTDKSVAETWLRSHARSAWSPDVGRRDDSGVVGNDSGVFRIYAQL